MLHLDADENFLLQVTEALVISISLALPRAWQPNLLYLPSTGHFQRVCMATVAF